MQRGDAVDVHDPPAWMRDLVMLRDGHCTFPRCTIDARSCDLDHTIPYQPDGPPGQTRPDNLACPLPTTPPRQDQRTLAILRTPDGRNTSGTAPRHVPSRHTLRQRAQGWASGGDPACQAIATGSPPHLTVPGGGVEGGGSCVVAMQENLARLLRYCRAGNPTTHRVVSAIHPGGGAAVSEEPRWAEDRSMTNMWRQADE